MAEYIVDCSELPHPHDQSRTLVLPVSINGHVHERLIRCRDCDYYGGHTDYCRKTHRWVREDGFCSRAQLRSCGNG